MKVEVHLNGEKYIDFASQEAAEEWVKNYNDNARYKKNFIILPAELQDASAEPTENKVDMIRKSAESDRHTHKNAAVLRWTNDEMLIVLAALEDK
jgi:hypothetical protein